MERCDFTEAKFMQTCHLIVTAWQTMLWILVHYQNELRLSLLELYTHYDRKFS